jgi:hypothetical protein
MKTALAVLTLSALPALAEPPQVTGAVATKTGASWTFDVTLTHPDTGWDHYADAWQIETPDGTILGLRDLAHPHVDEQPFTRSLSGVTLPDGLTEVRIRARCLVDGWAKDTFALNLP